MNKNNRKILRYVIDIFLIILPVVLLFLIWFVKAKNHTLNTSIMPAPESVYKALSKQISKGYLWKHIRASFFRVIKGYLLGSILGFTIGTFAAMFRPLSKLLTVPIGFLRSIPAIALIPFFILSMGIGETSKIAVITFGTFWPVLINTMQGIKSAEGKLLEVGTIFCKSKFTIFRKIILPSAIPSVLTGLRLGSSSSWVCVVAAEMIAASAGIGFLITYSREMADPATLIVGTVILGIFGILIDLLFSKLNKKLVYWR